MPSSWFYPPMKPHSPTTYSILDVRSIGRILGFQSAIWRFHLSASPLQCNKASRKKIHLFFFRSILGGLEREQIVRLHQIKMIVDLLILTFLSRDEVRYGNVRV
jgi:hypothetical protein